MGHRTWCHGMLLTIVIPVSILCFFLRFLLYELVLKVCFLDEIFQLCKLKSSLPPNASSQLPGEEGNYYTKKLSLVSFHHLNSLRWQEPVAGGYCFLPGSELRLPWTLSFLMPKLWELGQVLGSQRVRHNRASLKSLLSSKTAFLSLPKFIFLTQLRNGKGAFLLWVT